MHDAVRLPRRRGINAEFVRTRVQAEFVRSQDAREILHVTFGSVLTTREANGRLRYYDRFMQVLRANPEAYAANLERHFLRHLKPFATI